VPGLCGDASREFSAWKKRTNGRAARIDDIDGMRPSTIPLASHRRVALLLVADLDRLGADKSLLAKLMREDLAALLG
jgi:hypothetical protein